LEKCRQVEDEVWFKYGNSATDQAKFQHQLGCIYDLVKWVKKWAFCWQSDL